VFYLWLKSRGTGDQWLHPEDLQEELKKVIRNLVSLHHCAA
jgi:hypothetical protein